MASVRRARPYKSRRICIDGFSDGVWFVELAPLTSGEYIPTTVAQALDLTLASEGDPVENLVRALKGKQPLLVFDNCEHLVEPAARVISRHPARCAESQGARIEPPSSGNRGRSDVPSAVARLRHRSDRAVRRARARPRPARFRFTDENAPIVADICRRLDGIPLAIELAAARVKMLSAKQLRERLDERFRVLTGGDRSALPRHQTMRALIDWSHDLLDERERTLFRRLGIFVNGFALEGAVAVGSGDDLDELDVFDVLASLVDKSLVLAEPQGDALRYGLLESTRAYALEKLDDAGERDLVADRHLRYLRDRFARAAEEARADRTTYRSSLRRCRPNWRTCARRSTLRWRVRRWSTAPSCSPTLTGVGKPSDSMRKAWHGAKRISRRFRRTTRGCAPGC